MTMRERMLAVIQGRDHDRVPFAQYSGLAAPDEEVWSLIGRENMGLLSWTSVHRAETPNCRWEHVEIEREGRSGVRNTLHTPEGSLTEEKLREPAYGTYTALEHFVSEPGDYRVLACYLRDMVVKEDSAPLEQTLAWLGEDGLPMVATNRTPWQQLWVQWVSLEDLGLHIVDCPEEVEECASLMADIERRIHRIIADVAHRLPVSFVDVPDNITAPVIGERLFRRYCTPLYRNLADTLSDLDIPVVVHMDGDLRPLWQAIGESGVRGLDSMSPPPDNDTSVAQALSMWPYMRVLVNFPSSVHLAEPRVVYETAMRLLEESRGTGRLQIQISENVPAHTWRTSFPEIARAIRDFGAT